ncbi:efflux RND transporter permease subunit [Halomonas janggokensis]|uniref:Efflux RND transporter permease subunit n=1 Tax=Vreelandella janggokensis TaxID=370767 RepID=A0ABT4IU06_9GAMM|nr:efflux RND transporter permease subunit [Halomonas janggokensis]MCZ0927146.1 efflux RND transporter permease subunit [Halomonas janggokensis]MCZ0929654.1 efflux RND transporter permease subunit [Halomonas janggokensis]
MVDYFLRHRAASYLMTVVLLAGGALAFLGMGQLEFPEFTIRNALITTQYPGATPEEVEQEVTSTLEESIQGMSSIKRISSVSSDGLSQITVELESTVQNEELEQLWDSLRRNVQDAQAALPPGASQSRVNDDFGDVFGFMVNLTGEGYSMPNLADHADFLKRELALVDGVEKVSLGGEHEERIFIEVDREKLRALNIPLTRLQQLLDTQNAVADSGHLEQDGRRFRITPTGSAANIDDLRALIVSEGDGELVRLSDIADISRELAEQPQQLYRDMGRPAMSLGVSFESGVNVVEVGERLQQRLDELQARTPLGMELNVVYDQPQVVDEAVSGFLVSLIQAVAIVIVVLMLFMGWRSGLLMGFILLITIIGTFMLMRFHGLQLEKISLGALIIALGMLVDNAIVVTEGMLVGLKRGNTIRESAHQVIRQNAWPLLAATLIAIAAFAPIGLSPDTTGEFIGSLFFVLLYSLLLSWITALTLTPFYFKLFFRNVAPGDGQEDPYKGIVYRVFSRVIITGIRFRWVTLVLVVAILAGAVVGFGSVKNAFFPASNTPIFFVDYRTPEGTDILETQRRVSELEDSVMAMDGIRHLTTTVGGGAQRFTLTYSPEDRYSSYAQLIVETDDKATQRERMADVEEVLKRHHGDIDYKIAPLEVGPAPKAKLEARFYGSDPEVLRQLGYQVEAMFRDTPHMTSVRTSWGNRVQAIEPVFMEDTARRLGVTREDLAATLALSTSGSQVGIYRDGSDLIPMVARAIPSQRHDVDNLGSLNVWSEEQGRYITADQVISDIRTQVADPLIKRRNRERMLAVYGEPDPLSGVTAASVLAEVRPEVEDLELPPGYRLEWGGEYETAGEAQSGLFSSLPLGLVMMFIITVVLFNNFRQPLAIWSLVPLTIIGVVGALLLTGLPFSFMALLGTLSLIGMVIKNAIVLVEEINVQLPLHQDRYHAVVRAAISRVRPVAMAALTTMLGMIPLISDAFFASMAVALIGGLGVATLLTLVVLPVVYCVLYRIKVHADA